MPDRIEREDLARMMAAMDLCFMTTKSQGGGLSSRPMSNNAQVDWDGSNWFFSHGDTRKVAELRADPTVDLTFQSDDTWIALSGSAILHQDDPDLFRKYWTEDIERWFDNGIETEGLTLIEVASKRAEVQGSTGEARLDL